MTLARRTFLTSTIAAALGTAVFPPSIMADWPKIAFEAKTVEEALMALFTNPEVEKSDQIKIQAPDIAENGAIVPIEVTTDLHHIESIAIIAEKNPVPLVAQFNLTEKAKGWVKTRIKMAETSPVVVVVKANGKLHVARRDIQVTEGGCIS